MRIARLLPFALAALLGGRGTTAAAEDALATGPEAPATPSVVGLPLGVAEEAILGSGLVPHPRFVVVDGAPAWTVVAQGVVAGRAAKPWAWIPLEVAVPREAPSDVRVPSLFGLTDARAREVLGMLGLEAEVAFEPSLHPADTVFGQRPLPGTAVAPGARIALRVTGKVPPGWDPERVEVPNLLGLAASAAHLRLLDAGLRGSLVRERHPAVPATHVARQVEVPGARVLPGSTVTFVLPRHALVPDVLGRDAASAAVALDRAGLAARLIGEGGSAGAVVGQDPAPGALTSEGSVVVLRLDATAASAPGPGPAAPWSPLVPSPPLVPETPAPPPAPVEPLAPMPTHPSVDRAPALRVVIVPDVVGRTVEEARRAIVAAGLVAGRFAGPEGTGTRRVARQVPAAGTRTNAGVTVVGVYELVPASGAPAPAPRTARVPNVVGMTLPAARETIRAAGFLPGPFTTSSPWIEGTTRVLTQVPVAGALSLVGATVRGTFERVMIAVPRSSEEPSASGSTTPLPSLVPRMPDLTVTVPDVRRLSVGAAREALTRARLAVREEGPAIAGRDTRTVLSQVPAAGTRVMVGATVTISYRASR